nr:hypothetical transcript [Hymenolepis microstoma]
MAEESENRFRIAFKWYTAILFLTGICVTAYGGFLVYNTIDSGRKIAIEVHCINGCVIYSGLLAIITTTIIGAFYMYKKRRIPIKVHHILLK